MVIRYNIVQGDATTASGVVTGATDHRFANMGKPLAMEGDAVWCPACRTEGRIVCTGPRRPGLMYGRRPALSGDLCHCRCTPSPRLIHSMTNMCHELTQEEVIAQGFAWHPAVQDFVGEAGTYDEQVGLSLAGRGASLAGLPYRIETSDGRVFTGALDADGALPRIATENWGSYRIYWGDDALARG